MTPYDKGQKIKSALLALENYIIGMTKNGPTALSTYLENFSAKLLGIYYGYAFINLNYAKKNIGGIDLINRSHNHAIQITSERLNSKKVKETLKKAEGYSLITVFFYDKNKPKRIINNLKKSGIFADNLVVLSLENVFKDIDENPEKINQYESICDLWISGNIDYSLDLIKLINSEMIKKITSNKLSKKYIPEIYISERELKDKCRIFVSPKVGNELLIFQSRTLFKGSRYETMKDKKVVFADGQIVGNVQSCNPKDILKKKTLLPEEMEILVKNLELYEKIIYNIRNDAVVYNQAGEEISFDEKYANLESGVNFTISKMLRDYSLINKKFFFIVKDAGQGKTSFLCDFCENVLLKRNIPTFYFNINELSNNILDSFLKGLARLLSKSETDSIKLLEQYCSVLDIKAILVLDGLNESANTAQLRKELLDLFRYVDQQNYLKVIATSRNIAYQTYFKSFNEESFSSLIIEDIENNIYNNRKGETFQKKLYSKYKFYFNFSCFVSRTTQKKLSNDTLLLRIFSEVYENNTSAIVNDIYLYKLFREYINKRAQQLLIRGKIKRVEDLFELLTKIASNMIDDFQFNDFSSQNFTSEEKDLLDLIVNEDILIKTCDTSNQALLPVKVKYAFTYDEFRDYLLANVLLNLDKNKFQKILNKLQSDFSRYDGVLIFLFIICKSNNSDKMKIIENIEQYNKLYWLSIFSIDDADLNESDVDLIKSALSTKDRGLFMQIIKRLDVAHYKNLSVIVLVDKYLSKPQIPLREWREIFIEYDYYFKTYKGIILLLIDEKAHDTTASELFGILLLFSTFGGILCEVESDYLKCLYNSYQDNYVKEINKIKSDYPALTEGAERLLDEVKE